MNCQEWEENLNDLVDGLLDGPGAARAESHAASCQECGRTLEGLRSLRAQAEALPREEEPARDLWPGIRAGLPGAVTVLRPEAVRGEDRHPSRWLMGLAAAAILVVGFLTGLLLRPGVTTPAGSDPIPVSYRDAEAEYRQIADDLLRFLGERRGELSAETLAVVDENLRIIDAAIREVRVALEDDPGDAGNGRRFTHLYGRKVALLRQAVALPAES